MRASLRYSIPKVILVFLMGILFACTSVFYSKNRTIASEGAMNRSSSLSGVLDFKKGCQPGYYSVILSGVAENAGIQVEAQSDALGRFAISAPPGKYVASTEKTECGFKESIELENHTEHMVTFLVQPMETLVDVVKEIPTFPSRLPASVLVPIQK